jgi:hypothetical protein
MPFRGAPSIPSEFRGRARRLEALDIAKSARDLGVEEDVLRAVLEVESRGSGFDRSGRPAVLFEPHVFWRELSGARRTQAERQGLAYRSWGMKPYPRDSYPRLERAIEIDREAALRSASWGLPQLMGFNHLAAGYPSAAAMVAAFCEDEERHLAAMIQFIKSRGLDRALQDKDWAAFARAYNGASYAKNAYDKRLAAAYRRWRAKPDIVFDLKLAELEQARADKETEDVRIEQMGATFADRARIQSVQERLIALGYHMVGKADGIMGPRTVGAIAAFEQANDIQVNGKITPHLIERLETAAPLEIPPARAEGTPEGSRIVSGATDTGIAGGAIGITGALGVAGPFLDQAEAAHSFVARARALIEPVRELFAQYWPLIALAIGLWVAVRSIGVIRARIEDHRTGKTA